MPKSKKSAPKRQRNKQPSPDAAPGFSPDHDVSPQASLPARPAPTDTEALATVAARVDSMDSRLDLIATMLGEVAGRLPPLNGASTSLSPTTSETRPARREQSCAPSPPRSATIYQHPNHPARADPRTTRAVRLSDLHTDEDVVDKVTRALQYSLEPEDKGKYFAHNFITRGQKRVRATLGELSLPEYVWGFLQLIKTTSDEKTRTAMHEHLENLVDDARQYDWPNVRFWSEEVCARVADGRFAWESLYEIDRLQTRYSHAPSTVQRALEKAGQDYMHITDTPLHKNRPAKAGPPCQAYQQGECTERGHHVINGQRYLHVCAYCALTKAAQYTHPEHQCRSKRSNQSGFGN